MSDLDPSSHDELLAGMMWLGPPPRLNLFAVFPADRPVEFDWLSDPVATRAIARTRVYDILDDDSHLLDQSVKEFDFELVALPPSLELVLEGILRDAIRGGAVVAWFGFEGSLDLSELLTEVSAIRIYGVAAGDVVELALEDSRRARRDWIQCLSGIRAAIRWRKDPESALQDHQE